jgi:hypothetical protein
VPQLPTTRTLCKGMYTSTSDMYVLSRSRSRHTRLFDTLREDPRKKEPKQIECPVDFYKIRGQWEEHPYIHSRIQDMN